MQITVLNSAMLDNLKRTGTTKITVLSHFNVENELSEQNSSKVYGWWVKRPRGKVCFFFESPPPVMGVAALLSNI